MILELDAAKLEIGALKTSFEKEKIQKTQGRVTIHILRMLKVYPVSFMNITVFTRHSV